LQFAEQEDSTMRKTLWLLTAVAIFGLPMVARGQWPGRPQSWQGAGGMAPNGGLDPFGRPNFPGMPGGLPRFPPGINPGGQLPPGFPVLPNQEKRRDDSPSLQTLPHVIPYHIPNFSVPPKVKVSETEFNPFTRSTPAAGEASGLARSLSECKGKGFLAGIGGAIAAACGGIFGRRKES
jgi:hypothetical protein